jgi:adenylylsulfate kinase
MKLARLLFSQGIKVFILDGDNTRLGVNKDLGFTLDDRKENIRRVAEIAKLFIDSGTVILTSFISPIKEEREMAKQIIGEA